MTKFGQLYDTGTCTFGHVFSSIFCFWLISWDSKTADATPYRIGNRGSGITYGYAYDRNNQLCVYFVPFNMGNILSFRFLVWNFSKIVRYILSINNQHTHTNKSYWSKQFVDFFLLFFFFGHLLNVHFWDKNR